MAIELWLSAILIGSVCGLLGQALRVIVGLYKASQADPKQEFNWARLIISLLMGALAGSLAGLVTVSMPTLALEQILTLMSAGYAGADFIEGFIGKYLP